MGYFDNIFPELKTGGDEPPRPAKGFVPQGWKVRRKGEDFWRLDETETGPDDELKPPDEREVESSPTAPPDLKSKVKAAHADIESAYGDALKVIKAYDAGDIYDVEGRPTLRAQDFHDLQSIASTIDKRGAFDPKTQSSKTDVNPIKLADDLRVIATRPTVPPEYAKLLHGAADKLTRAYKAQGELEALRQPEQPLAVTPQEVEGRKQYLAGEIQKREEALKTAGSLRSPQLTQELKGLREEEGRVNLVGQPAAASAPGAPSVTPENPSGEGPIQSNFKALGVHRRQLIDSLVKTLDGIGVSIDELDDTVPFESGMLRVLAMVDPKATLAQRAVGELRQQEAQGQSQGGEQQQKNRPEAGGLVAQRNLDVENNQNRIKQLYRELGTSPFGNTWLGMICYVLLGMLMGPQMAAKILSRRNDGALRGEIEYLKDEIKEQIARRDQQAREQQEYRKMYVQHYLTSQRQTQDDARSFRNQLILTQVRGQQALQRAMAAKKGEKDSILAGLQEDFRNASSMAGKYAQAMDMDTAAKWNKKAESLIPLIQQRRNQLATPDEGGSEEPEE